MPAPAKGRDILLKFGVPASPEVPATPLVPTPLTCLSTPPGLQSHWFGYRSILDLMPPLLSGVLLLIVTVSVRFPWDKVHPPSIDSSIVRSSSFPHARVIRPRMWPPILFQSSRLHPRSLANDRAPAGAPGVATPIRFPPGRTGVPSRLDRSQAAQSMGQTVGVRGVFPCHACATHWLTSLLQPPGAPTKVVSPLHSECTARMRTALDLCTIGSGKCYVGDLVEWWWCPCAVWEPIPSSRRWYGVRSPWAWSTTKGCADISFSTPHHLYRHNHSTYRLAAHHQNVYEVVDHHHPPTSTAPARHRTDHFYLRQFCPHPPHS